MPADPENVEDVGGHLRRLEGETQGVDWESPDAVRLRGRQRGQRRAIAGTMVVCLGIATLGVSLTGNLPGQKGFLNTTVPIAGIPSQERTVPENPSDDSATEGGSEGDGSTEASDPNGEQGGGGSTDGTKPTSDATPTASRTPPETPPTDSPPTSPSDEDSRPTATESPTEDSSPSPTVPTIDVAAVASTSELPSITDGSWAELGSGSGEGAAADAWRCTKPALEDLDALSAAWRTSEWTPEPGRSGKSGKTGGPLPGGAASAAFPSDEVASDAYDQLVEAVEGCDWGSAGAATSVSLDSGTGAWWTVTKDSEAHVAGLVQRGSALAYVVVDLPAKDTAVSMDATLQAAADRLAPWEG